MSLEQTTKMNDKKVVDFGYLSRIGLLRQHSDECSNCMFVTRHFYNRLNGLIGLVKDRFVNYNEETHGEWVSDIMSMLNVTMENAHRHIGFLLEVKTLISSQLMKIGDNGYLLHCGHEISLRRHREGCYLMSGRDYLYYLRGGYAVRDISGRHKTQIDTFVSFHAFYTNKWSELLKNVVHNETNFEALERFKIWYEAHKKLYLGMSSILNMDLVMHILKFISK